MKELQIPTELFGTLIGRLRARGIGWTTWRIEAKNHVYTGRGHKKIVKQEIRALLKGQENG